MGKYRKDYSVDSDDSEFQSNKFPQVRHIESDFERAWGNKKKRKSKQFRQARKKRSLGQ